MGECRTVKKKIIENLIFNIGNQSQKNTIVEFSSAFDLQRSCDKATRLECLKKLFSIYGRNYSRKVLNESKNDYHAYNITVNYPPKLQCSENELISWFNSMWHHLNRLWLKYKDNNPVVTRMFRFWVKVIEEHSIEYPNISDLIIILLCISPGTGPLERSFNTLAKICYKDRSNTNAEYLEVLYLLSTLAITDTSDNQLFEKAREYLQK